MGLGNIESMNYFLSMMIDVLTALLTPTVAILGIYIAIQQYRLAKEKHRIEIYDRRMKIYAATLELIRNTNRNADISEDAYYKFEEGIAEAEFLFGKEVVALLEDIDMVGFNILSSKIDVALEAKSTKSGNAKWQHADLMNKFLLFELRVKTVFAPYFRLPISAVRKPAVYNQRIADTITEEQARGDEDIPF